MKTSYETYLESGKKRVFAGALAWPGWCRSGRDEAAALQALVDYAPRYARALDASGIAYQGPASVADLAVVERLEGGVSTDFGAPEAIPAWDDQPLDEVELNRLIALLSACWQTFDAAVHAAEGKTLRLGPRGGGRDLEKIARHVLEAEKSYLARLGGKMEKSDGLDMAAEQAMLRQTALDTLVAWVKAPDSIPAQGPRGGKRWTPRYFVRRDAWHVLDHAWEIEDRQE